MLAWVSHRRLRLALLDRSGPLQVAAFMLMLYGICSAALCWMVVAAVDALGVERFQWPPHDKLGMLFLNVCLDSVYNGLLLFGILVATPLFMSVGCMLVRKLRAHHSYDVCLHAAAAQRHLWTCLGLMWMVRCPTGHARVHRRGSTCERHRAGACCRGRCCPHRRRLRAVERIAG